MKMNKVGIIGVGFMGASLALAIKEKYPGAYIVGYARTPRSYSRLKRLNILDKVSRDLKEVTSRSNLLVLATPTLSIIEHFKKIRPFLKKNTLVIDMGSTKSLIEQAAKKFLPKDVFVGCHPLCGSEKRGAQNASRDLYKDAVCIITSRNKARDSVKKFWQSLGCKIHYLSPWRHDKMLSCISHLPHVIAFSLTRYIPKEYLGFTPTSFRNLTRVSSSSAEVWADIFLSNRTYLIKDISEYIIALRAFEKLLKSNSRVRLLEMIEKVNLKHKACQR